MVSLMRMHLIQLISLYLLISLCFESKFEISFKAQALQASDDRPLRLMLTTTQMTMPQEQANALNTYLPFLLEQQLSVLKSIALQVYSSAQTAELIGDQVDLTQCQGQACVDLFAQKLGADLSLSSAVFFIDHKYQLLLILSQHFPLGILSEQQVTVAKIEDFAHVLPSVLEKLFEIPQKKLQVLKTQPPRYQSKSQATVQEQAHWQKLGIQWMKIEGGELLFGSNLYQEESPQSRVQVQSFLMMRNEVTVGQYFACVQAGVCSPNGDESGCLTLQAYDLRAVNCVTWQQAQTFSKWIGARLPSEAEWEWAAKGPSVNGSQGRKFPWGDEPASCAFAVMKENQREGCGSDGVGVVCSKSRGNTPEGICDLAGNVWEWCADDWLPHLEGVSAQARINQTQKAWMGLKVYKGGSWYHEAKELRTANRGKLKMDKSSVGLGFRCVL